MVKVKIFQGQKDLEFPNLKDHVSVSRNFAPDTVPNLKVGIVSINMTHLWVMSIILVFLKVMYAIYAILLATGGVNVNQTKLNDYVSVTKQDTRNVR